jgi:uncharacterized protein YqgV (UPF0045/DUF77 family)
MEVANREQELSTVRNELSEIRQSLFEQYRQRREQVEQMNQVVQGAASSFEAKQGAQEAELIRRRRELDDEAHRMQDYISSEVNRRIAEQEAEIRRQRMRLDAAYANRIQELDAEAANRRARFEEDLQTFEPRLTALSLERDQLVAARRDVEQQQISLNALREDISRQQAALDAERRWNDERLSEQERLQLARESEISHQEELLQQEREAFEQLKLGYADDVLRFDRWQAAVEDRHLIIDRRAAEVDQMVKQLTRDAIELEEHTRLADSEHQRVSAEAARLDQLKNSLDERNSQLSKRSAELEAQQASLAVFRARLDRQQDELHREASALTSDRSRLDVAQRDLDVRLHDAEQLRASLGSFHTTNADSERALTERQLLLDAEMAEVRRQKEQVASESTRLQNLQHELDIRSADIAEQTAVLKAKTTQVMELQQRLEADRTSVRTRESTLTDSDVARVTFQEQLRRRSDELSIKSKELDALASKFEDDRLSLERLRTELTQERDRSERTIVTTREQLVDQSAELERRLSMVADRESALERQIERLRETGRTVAGGKKELTLAMQQWQAQQSERTQQTILASREMESFRAQIASEFQELQQQAPALESEATIALTQLTSAREVLRSQLAELHAYANESRETLNSLRNDLRAETERVRVRETELEKARGEHRLAVSEFRGQLLDWQTNVANLKTAVSKSETRIEIKQAELLAASKKADDTVLELARRMEQLRIDQDDLSERRVQVERHLSEMREWYRKKLRDLAEEKRVSMVAPPVPRIASSGALNENDLEPGDLHLGELLRKLELVDGETLAALWEEARRQNRTLRQVLLASGTVTLYQLALIEAGNLDSLMLGRFRVIDRVRVTPREAVYRAYDPTRNGVFVLRVLGDAEMSDASHPDEYRQRFRIARDATHPNLITTLEVLEINGRPAALQEYASGLPGSEWSTHAAVPGVWLRAFTMAVSGLESAHRVGLVHGRITTDTFILTPSGSIKVLGFGDPPWLSTGLSPNFEPTTATDLRALGQVGFIWSQTATKRRARAVKGFPEPLLVIIRRLESDPANPMGDTTTGVEPYRSASDLLVDLQKLAAKYPCPPEEWGELVGHVAMEISGDVSMKRAG